MIQLSDEMLEQIIAGLQELQSKRRIAQLEEYRKELAESLVDEINRNIMKSSFAGMSASVGESTSRTEHHSHGYEYYHAEESKTSQRDFDRLAHTVSELQENGITRLELVQYKHDVEMEIERLKHVISMMEKREE